MDEEQEINALPVVENDTILSERFFIELRDGTIESAGMVGSKMKDNTLFSVTLIDLDTCEFQPFDLIVPLEAIVVRQFRFYEDEDEWSEDVNRFVDEKEVVEEELAEAKKKTDKKEKK